MTLSEYEQYKNEVQISITQSIESLGRNLDDLQYSLKSANSISASYSQKGYSEELALEKIKLDTLEAISESLFSLQNSSDSLLRDLNSIKLSISESSVIAPIDGIVNLHTELNAGDYLQNGTEIATLIPGADGEYKVLLAVLNEDIADITEGQQVHYRFSALPFSEYGELSGKITKISTDARNSNSGQSYYLVEAEIENRTLYSKKNVPAEIKVGMTVEARVVTKSQKIIFWALDKLNIFDWT